jgi:hypothetical protein
LRHKDLGYRFNFCAILRQISGKEVAVIAILRNSPKINGVSPALIVADQDRPREVFSHTNPEAKIMALPKVSAGNEVLNF